MDGWRTRWAIFTYSHPLGPIGARSLAATEALEDGWSISSASAGTRSAPLALLVVCASLTVGVALAAAKSSVQRCALVAGTKPVTHERSAGASFLSGCCWRTFSPNAPNKVCDAGSGPLPALVLRVKCVGDCPGRGVVARRCASDASPTPSWRSSWISAVSALAGERAGARPCSAAPRLPCGETESRDLGRLGAADQSPADHAGLRPFAAAAVPFVTRSLFMEAPSLSLRRGLRAMARDSRRTR
jgi:hypothetical protein